MNTQSRTRASRSALAIAIATALGGTLAIAALAPSPATAVTSTVTTPAQLVTAFLDGSIDLAVLGADLTSGFPTSSLASNHDLTLDLAGHRISVTNLTVGGGTHLTIDDTVGGGQLTADTTSVAFGRAGITTTSATLEVKGGAISAKAWGSAAGIGGDSTGRDGGTFLMSGGTVTATGGAYSAGIGGSSPDAGTLNSGGTVTISGGTVTASGGIYSAGIGGGAGGWAGIIGITGGTVTATGGQNGPGIGNGRVAVVNPGDGTAVVTIDDAVVTARGGQFGGPGIGGGYGASGVALEVRSGATVTVSDEGGYQPLGYGYGNPSTWWGSYEIAGTLVLANNFQIPLGQQIVVNAGGVVEGPGTIRQNFFGAQGGTVVNGGVIRASVDAWTAVTGNNFVVTFQANRADAVPATARQLRVYAPSFVDAQVALPSFPAAAGALAWGWNTASDGNGIAFDGATTLTTSLTVYADWRPFTGLTVTPSDTTVVAGGTVTVSVLGHEPLSGLTSDQTAYSTYSSDILGDAIAGNQVTMTQAGPHVLEATVSGVSGSTVVTVLPGDLDSIVAIPHRLEPGNVVGDPIGTSSAASATAGTPIIMVVEGFDEYGNSLGDLTSSATVTSSGAELPSGTTFTPTVAGERQVITTVDGIGSTLDVEIEPGPLASAAVDAPATATAGSAVTVTATGLDAYGNELGELSDWTVASSEPDDDIVGAEVTARVAGTRTLTVTPPAPAAAQQLQLIVTPGEIARLELTPPVDPDDSVLAVAGDTVDFRVDGWDAYDNAIGDVTSSVRLETDSPGADVDASGASFTFFRAGASSITATLLEDDGITASAPVLVVPAALAEVRLATATLIVDAGSPVPFEVTGFDAYGNEVSLCGCQELTTAQPSDVIADDEITFHLAGERVVTVEDAATGISGTVTVLVQPSEPVELQITTSVATVTQGGTLTFHVSGTDEFGNEIDQVAGATLTSDQPTDVIDGLTVSFPHASPHRITVNVGQLSATMVIEVIPTLAATGAEPSGLLLSAAILALMLGVILRRRGRVRA